MENMETDWTRYNGPFRWFHCMINGLIYSRNHSNATVITTANTWLKWNARRKKHVHWSTLRLPHRPQLWYSNQNFENMFGFTLFDHLYHLPNHLSHWDLSFGEKHTIQPSRLHQVILPATVRTGAARSNFSHSGFQTAAWSQNSGISGMKWNSYII